MARDLSSASLRILRHDLISPHTSQLDKKTVKGLLRELYKKTPVHCILRPLVAPLRTFSIHPTQECALHVGTAPPRSLSPRGHPSASVNMFRLLTPCLTIIWSTSNSTCYRVLITYRSRHVLPHPHTGASLTSLNHTLRTSHNLFRQAAKMFLVAAFVMMIYDHRACIHSIR
jgi:hypothetical protein